MVVDSQHWTGFGLFTGFNDDFFMSLMFFVSGLFLWSSLKRKGNAAFITDRLRRLGIPFLFAAAIIAPVAYYPSYLLTTGAHSVGGYIHDWLSFGDWPTGPAWFIWLLLAFDLVAAALYAIRPNFGDALGRIASNARQHPVRFFLLLVTVSAAVFIPMLAIFGAMSWTSIGPFQFQTARLFHYAVYFLAGIGVGAYGIDRGLLAPDGILARHWMRWTIAMLVVFAVSVVFMLVVITKGATMSPVVLNTVGGAMFALTCGAIIVRIHGAVRALRHAPPLALGQPERQRIWNVSNPLHVRVMAAARDSQRAASGHRKRTAGIRGRAAAQLEHQRISPPHPGCRANRLSLSSLTTIARIRSAGLLSRAHFRLS